MESHIIPLVAYWPMSGSAGRGAASIPFLFSQVCLNQIRLSLFQRGLPESLVLTGSVTMKEDHVTGERCYWLGSEELLFRAKVVIKCTRHNGQWRDMYCAALSKPKLLHRPGMNSQPHAEPKFTSFMESLRRLIGEFAQRDLELNIICYDTDEVVLGVGQLGEFLPANEFVTVRREILARLAKHGYTIRVYDYGGQGSQLRPPAVSGQRLEPAGH